LGGDVRELHISHVGLSEADLKRLKAVMVAIVSNGDVDARWCMGDATTANLVLVSPDSDVARQFAVDPARNPRQVIAAVVGESDSVSFECEKLAWPIRLTSLLDLLKRVEARASKVDASDVPDIPNAPADNQLMQLARLLREGESADDLVWRVSGLSNRPVYVAAQQRSFIYEDSLLNLLQFDPHAALQMEPITADQLPPQDQRKPIRMLQWLIGLRSGRIGLLPWLKAGSTFRLKQFPEFQLLHHSSEHRRIAAALSRPRSGIQAISDATELSLANVIAFVNAASLCGYLKVSDGGAIATATKKPVAGTRRALFQVFRRALGIASNDG
jgi:hypothetical protein